MTTTEHKNKNTALNNTALNNTALNNTAPNNNIEPLFAKDYNVYINHTDAGGIVYHANHLVFFENCRRDWFTKLGLNGYFLQTDDGDVQHFVVSQADLQYKRAILLDEIISVRIDKVELKPASMIFYQSIHRTLSDDDTAKTISSQLLSSTKIVIACVQNLVKPEPMANEQTDNNKTDTTVNTPPMRPIRVPKQLRDSIGQAISAQMSGHQ
ncbi:acyl-CoA thioesterase [Psychrobacter sp. PP-21]|uniref:hotdog domain-containing protein n=1 Tax=Psychrobacter sp. PP-21 TaxID=2957503 RepID=UPI0029A5CA5C|nr:hotdog domain-containing protein [Psychrobacter sp. PP-21]MDX2373032.1 acyl-CoA thioesterase [Psychrobacter sp. PP-21]